MEERRHCDVTVTSNVFNFVFSLLFYFILSLLPFSSPSPPSSPPFLPLWQAEKRPCLPQDKMPELVRAKRGAEKAKT